MTKRLVMLWIRNSGVFCLTKLQSEYRLAIAWCAKIWKSCSSWASGSFGSEGCLGMATCPCCRDCACKTWCWHLTPSNLQMSHFLQSLLGHICSCQEAQEGNLMPLSHPEVESSSLTTGVVTLNTKLLDLLQNCKVWVFFQIGPQTASFTWKSKEKNRTKLFR